MADHGLMTSVRPRLLAAVPLLGLAVALMPSSAPATLPDSCNGFVDVALGSPKANVGGLADGGTVTLVFESEDGTFGNDADLTITEADLNGGVAPAAYTKFGASVVWGFEDSEPSCSIVAVGAPGANGGAGKVYVFTVDKDGIVPASITVISQDTAGVEDTAEPGDGFGSSLHFGGDLSVSWLAVGSPGEDIGSAVDAGVVHVLPYASGWGTGSLMYRQGRSPVTGGAETGDHFGAALGAGRDVWSLWVGAPEEDLGTRTDTGVITSLRGSYDATKDVLTLPGKAGAVTISQDSTGVPGSAEKGDHFGAVLTALVGTQSTDRQPVIGVPGENLGSAADVGAIVVTYSDNTWAAFVQGTKTTGGAVDDKPEAGDRFGASLSAWGTVLLIGAPGEDVGTIKDAGMIHRMTAKGAPVPKLSAAREQSVTQNTSAVDDSAETGDRYGAAVAFGINGAVIGVPGEDVTGVVDAGALSFLRYISGVPENGLTATGDLVLWQGTPHFPGTLETGSGFGSVAYSIAQ